MLTQSPLIYTKEMHRISTVSNRQFFRQFSSTKAIVPYTPQPLATATALSNLPLLNDAIHYLTTAPSQKNTDIIYHVMDANDRFLDISIYKDFKQNQHFFSVHFNITPEGIDLYKKTVKKIENSSTPLKYTFQPHFGKIEIAIQLEEPSYNNGRRVLKPLKNKSNKDFYLSLK